MPKTRQPLPLSSRRPMQLWSHAEGSVGARRPKARPRCGRSARTAACCRGRTSPDGVSPACGLRGTAVHRAAPWTSSARSSARAKIQAFALFLPQPARSTISRFLSPLAPYTPSRSMAWITSGRMRRTQCFLFVSPPRLLPFVSPSFGKGEGPGLIIFLLLARPFGKPSHLPVRSANLRLPARSGISRLLSPALSGDLPREPAVVQVRSSIVRTAARPLPAVSP